MNFVAARRCLETRNCTNTLTHSRPTSGRTPQIWQLKHSNAKFKTLCPFGMSWACNMQFYNVLQIHSNALLIARNGTAVSNKLHAHTSVRSTTKREIINQPLNQTNFNPIKFSHIQWTVYHTSAWNHIWSHVILSTCQAAEVWSLETFGHGQDPEQLEFSPQIGAVDCVSELGQTGEKNIRNCQLTNPNCLPSKLVCTCVHVCPNMHFLSTQIQMQVPETQIPGFAWHSPLRPGEFALRSTFHRLRTVKALHFDTWICLAYQHGTSMH